jgi:hypothetical protein
VLIAQQKSYPPQAMKPMCSAISSTHMFCSSFVQIRVHSWIKNLSTNSHEFSLIFPCAYRTTKKLSAAGDEAYVLCDQQCTYVLFFIRANSCAFVDKKNLSTNSHEFSLIFPCAYRTTKKLSAAGDEAYVLCDQQCTYVLFFIRANSCAFVDKKNLSTNSHEFSLIFPCAHCTQ